MQQRQRTWGWEAVVLTVLVLIGGVWLGGQALGSGPAQPVSTESPTSASGYPAAGPTPTTQPGPYPGPPTAAASPLITGTAAPPPTTDPLRATATAAYAGGVTYDLLNRFSIRLLPGWHAYLPPPDSAMGMATFLNYTHEALEANPERPSDFVAVRISTHTLPGDTTFEMWLSDQMARQTSPEYGVPLGTTLTEPEPVTLGKYAGTGYSVIVPDDDVWLLMFLRIDERRLASVSINPADSQEGASARDDALQILSTLDFLP
ncbi:MAG: hypothetical protein IT318_10410 [Anaerolineales bacterium]|nr:hypothetical protein [Anaerolineales bacterium]